MKKLILVIALVIGTIQLAKAQTTFGGGVSFGNGTSLEAKADFNVANQISVSPSINYFLNTAGYSAFQFNVDAHYNIQSNDDMVIYPLVGLNYYMITTTGYTGGSDLGLTLGAGSTYKLSESMKLYAELKYIRSGIGISAGILFSL